MAHSAKDQFGNSSTVTPSGSSGTAYLIGPPAVQTGGLQGRYILESGSGSNCVYRWLHDEKVGGPSPTSYRFTASN